MIDTDIARAVKGVVLEAAGEVLGNQGLADRGRLEQYRHLRRRQVKRARATLEGSDWTERALSVIRGRAVTAKGGRTRD